MYANMSKVSRRTTGTWTGYYTYLNTYVYNVHYENKIVYYITCSTYYILHVIVMIIVIIIVTVIIHVLLCSTLIYLLSSKKHMSISYICHSDGFILCNNRRQRHSLYHPVLWFFCCFGCCASALEYGGGYEKVAMRRGTLKLIL